MAIRVASLEAVLDLDKRAFEKNLRDADKGLDKASETLKDFTGQTGKLAAGLSNATNKGRLGLSEIDQGAMNAKGSLSSMMGVMGGGAAAAAESALNSVSGNLDKVGKSADDIRSKFGSAANTLTSRMDKAGQSVKDFGKDSERTMKDFIDDLRKAEDEAGKLGEAGGKIGEGFGGLGDQLSSLIPGFDQLASLATPAGALGLLAGGAAAVGAALISSGMESQRAMNMIEARTGATGAELESLGKTARRVFISNMGESLEDAANAVIQVNQVLGETGLAAEESAKKALTMRDVFGVDIPESLRAVRSANRTFGDETATTFDMMAALIQRVGDPYQDLADTINEYSADMAQAGFTQAEFFGILESGVASGARNFDVIADLMREFTIRIIDGSDKTKDALDRLFEATGRGNQEIIDLRAGLEDTTEALEDNRRALDESEGAYEAQARVVDDLESALSEAQRKLDELSRPNLKGIEEFDDRLFALDQRAKRLQLALLDLDEDTPAFENTRAQLEEVNKEIDRVALERDLTIEPQLRAIEKAAMEGREPIVTYEQALANVADQKDTIKDLEAAFKAQRDELIPLSQEYERLADENQRLIDLQEEQKRSLEDLATPADEFLQKLSTGEITQRDALSSVIQMLSQVEDQIVADQIAVDLMGTKAEELGVNIITSLDPAVNKMTEFEGATNRAAEAMNSGLGSAIENIKRLFKTGLGIIGEKVAEGDIGGLGEILGRGTKIVGGAALGVAKASIPGFAEGGIVGGGAMGEPVIVKAHVGERIVPPDQQASMTINFNAPIYGEQGIQQAVMDAFGQLRAALSTGGNR